MNGKVRRLGVVMDDISRINPVKDTTLAMLLEGQARGWELLYMEQRHLSALDGVPHAVMRPVTVTDDEKSWFSLGPSTEGLLASVDAILMRKDPPFNMEYIYTTYLLERAEEAGVLVVNRQASLRDVSEKAYVMWFPECCPPTLVTRDMDDMRRFLADQGAIVVKPLDGMGGRSIFLVRDGDPNSNVIFETLTEDGGRFAMAQTYIPEIVDGDKRIILIDGEPYPRSLARIPAREGDHRGNLAAGARYEGRELTERDREICARVGPVLRDKGLIFAGLDVIGDYLTEINVTSPTGVRELKKLYGQDPVTDLFDAIEARLESRG